MHYQIEMNILANDLDSIFHRIEALPAHELLTTAGELIEQAKEALKEAQGDLHQRDIRERYDL